MAELGTARPLTATIALEALLTRVAAPTLTLELPTGAYTVTATAEGYWPRTYPLTITAGVGDAHFPPPAETGAPGCG